MEANQDNDDGAPLTPEVKLPRPRRIIPKKPTAASASEAEAEAEGEGEVKSYFCNECDKIFSSGKALGGHKSTAHVQAKKNFLMKSEASSSSASPTFACSECDKVFPTDKSLCGHMRWHPERQWRGMKPAQPHSMAEDGSVDDQINNSGHELGFRVNGWPTSKRGRPATTSKEKGTKSKWRRRFSGLGALKIPESDEKPSGGAKDKEKIQNQDQSWETLILGGGGEVDSEDEQYKVAIEVLVTWKRWKRELEAAETSSSSSSKKLDSNLGPDFFSPTHHSDSESEGEMPIKKKKKEKLVMVTAAATGNEAKGDDGEMESSSAEKAEAVPFAFDLNKAPPMEEDD